MFFLGCRLVEIYVILIWAVREKDKTGLCYITLPWFNDLQMVFKRVFFFCVMVIVMVKC